MTILKTLLAQKKNLNHILSTFDDADHEIVNFCNSRYITFSNTAFIFQNSHNEFITLSLNVQSINAKFNQLYPIVSKLSSMGLYFGAICLQETWLTSNADLSLLKLPGYNIIHQGTKCTKHIYMFSTILALNVLYIFCYCRCYCRCKFVYPDKGYLTNDDLKQKSKFVDVILHIAFSPPGGLLASGQT